MTSGERRALWFLLLVALLGAAVRGCLRSPAGPSAAEIAALDAQIDSVTARRATGRKRPAGGGARSRRSSPAIPTGPRQRLDIDTATETELAELPYIGPALARRIVEDRIRHGAFGCASNLDSVPGIGLATLRRIDSLIIFRGTSARTTRCR